MSALKFLIDGRLEDGDLSMKVINPATAREEFDCPRASVAQLDRAVAAAKAAFPAWSRTPLAERKAALIRIAEIIEANAAELARLLTQEQGKPLAAATGETYGAAASAISPAWTCPRRCWTTARAARWRPGASRWA